MIRVIPRCLHLFFLLWKLVCQSSDQLHLYRWHKIARQRSSTICGYANDVDICNHAVREPYPCQEGLPAHAEAACNNAMRGGAGGGDSQARQGEEAGQGGPPDQDAEKGRWSGRVGSGWLAVIIG